MDRVLLFWLLIAALAPAPVLAATPALAPTPVFAPTPTERLHRVERVLAEVPAKGDTLRLVATVLRGRIGDPCYETIESLRVDGRSGQPYAEGMPSASIAKDGALETGVGVTAASMAWGKVRGLVLHRTYVHSGFVEDQRADWRYLALRGRRLVAISPWCDAHGQALPGFRLMGVKPFGWFDALIPTRLHVGRHHEGLALVPEKDRASGLALLPIAISEMAERDSAGPASPILLYRGPTAPESDTVLVSGATPVQFGKAYAEVGLADGTRAWGDRPPWHVAETRVALRRLEVVVGGRRGFVEERDFQALGLETEE